MAPGHGPGIGTAGARGRHDSGEAAAPGSLEELFRAPLDPVLTEAARLRALAALHSLPEGGSLSFTALRDLLQLTDGNLGMHLRVLTEAGYVEAVRQPLPRRRRTLYTTTPRGRAAFADHVAALEAIIRAAQGRP